MGKIGHLAKVIFGMFRLNDRSDTFSFSWTAATSPIPIRISIRRDQPGKD
jgi:hypothetical protein